MSVHALLWAHHLRIGLTPFQKLTLAVLAEHADDRGRNSWPSVATIAREAELAERTVQRSLRELMARGVITGTAGGGRGRTTLYVLDMSLQSSADADASDGGKGCHADTVSELTCGGRKGASVTPFPAKRVSARTERVSATTEKGVTQTPEPVLNLSMNQKGDDVVATAADRGGEAGRADVAFRLWNDFAKTDGLPIAQLLTDKRRGALRQRLIECGGIEGWRIALQKVAESPFLMGRKSRAAIDIDFLLQPTSFARLMEGRYGDWQKPAAEASGKDTLRAMGDHLRAKMGDEEWQTI